MRSSPDSPQLPQAAPRAAAYVRVSTNRQAEHETSLADQVAAITAYCEARGILLVDVYREPGASATDDNRPQFQSMVEAATARERPYDLIIVHSFSRFFRDQFEFERYRRKLAKAKVELVSITQDVGEGATGDLVRSILSKFDEYQSAETAKHVRRSMIANARDGFWNGSIPPLGYKVVIAERRGDKDKKVLAVDEAEAPLVRRIFSLYLEGDGASGPLGIKKIVSWLNARNYSYRGKPFHVSNVDVVLRRTTYMGTHYFNQRDSRTGERRHRDEWVPMAVPALVEEETFQLVQAQLGARNLRQTPARVVSGPTLLTGIARCGCPDCHGAMTIRTGKSGQYRYYACSRRATRGETACNGRSIRMEKLDGIVLDALEQRVLAPERLPELLAAFLEKSDVSDQRKREELSLLRGARTNSEGALNRLYELVEQGLASPADRDFAERLTHHRQRIVAISADIASLERQLGSSRRRITPDVVGRFGKLLSEGLRADNPALRQAYVRLLIDDVTVDETEIQIRGSRKALERAVIATAASAGTKVPIFAREWRTRQDSNLWPLPSEGSALSS
ncbi:recombinase family protein [Sphingomonas limnosediminicola]|uniref:Recombinase family protein n=1 Tax=Sphingomonas limnosediminicola TaxID=940133 RepID=A0ABP7LYQ5_9SPHN